MATIGPFDLTQSTDGDVLVDMGTAGITVGNITVTKWRSGDTAWQAVDAATVVTHELSNNLYRVNVDENDVNTLGPMVLRCVQGANVGVVTVNVIAPILTATLSPNGAPASSPGGPLGR